MLIDLKSLYIFADVDFLIAMVSSPYSWEFVCWNINGGYFSILLSVFKFAWLASFALKYSFEIFAQRRGQPGKFEYRQKNTKIAAIYESGL